MKKIIVLGDVMLDITTHVRVLRFSPEVDYVPVLKNVGTTYNPGGVANVAVNIKSLGGDPILFGITSYDHFSDKLAALLADKEVKKIFEYCHGGKTTHKERIVTPDGMLYRIDYDNDGVLEADYWANDTYGMPNEIIKYFNEPEKIIVFVNYNKGFFDNSSVEFLMDKIRNDNSKPILLVDPGKIGDWNKFSYENAIFKVNINQCMSNFSHYKEDFPHLLCPVVKPREYHPSVKMSASEFYDIGLRVQFNLKQLENLDYKHFDYKHVVITGGPNGILLVTKGSSNIPNLRTGIVEVADTCGAGDTVLAVLATGIAEHGMEKIESICCDATRAARSVVQKRGVAVAEKGMF